MKEESIRLSKEQVSFLMNRFSIEDPNEAIDALIEAMVLEEAEPTNMKLYIMKLMEKELEAM